MKQNYQNQHQTNVNNLDSRVNNISESYEDNKPILSLVAIANSFGKAFNAQPRWAKATEIGLTGLLAAGCTTQLPIVEEMYLNVPVVKQRTNWCLPASAKAVLNYYGMEITQEKIADYVINENGTGNISRLEENADKLGIEVYVKKMSLNGIKNELKESKPVIVTTDYSLEDPENHAFVAIGYNENKQEITFMCPLRGKITWSYSYFEKVNNNYFGGISNLCWTALIWPKDKSQINDLTNTAIQIIKEQTDLFDILKY
jgi:hypothetical protein